MDMKDLNPLLLVLNICAIAVMCYALYRVNLLRKRVPGGVVKSSLNILCEMIALFVMGYIITPFLPMFPQISESLLMAIMFFVVAIFVVIVIDLFYMVVSELGL